MFVWYVGCKSEATRSVEHDSNDADVMIANAGIHRTRSTYWTVRMVRSERTE